MIFFLSLYPVPILVVPCPAPDFPVLPCPTCPALPPPSPGLLFPSFAYLALCYVPLPALCVLPWPASGAVVTYTTLTSCSEGQGKYLASREGHLLSAKWETINSFRPHVNITCNHILRHESVSCRPLEESVVHLCTDSDDPFNGGVTLLLLFTYILDINNFS